MIEFEITKGFKAIIDSEDAYLIKDFKWVADVRRHGLVYVKAVKIISGKQRSYYLHRLVMQAKKGTIIDHKNHNGLDNRKVNLRLATPSQNLSNKRHLLKTSSIYKGVCFDKTHRRWVARIKVNNKTKKIGTFTSEVEAALAYNSHVKQLHGEFGILNLVY